MGTGRRLATVSATAPKTPPKQLWSSAVTIAPVLSAYSHSSSRSIGLTLRRLITAAETPSASSSSAARRACSTMTPTAASVTSEPSRRTSPLPTRKSTASGSRWRGAPTPRPSRTYTGPGVCSAANTAPRTSPGSAATSTFMLGSARMMAMSSIAWWVAPSSPTLIPPCVATILTLRLG